MLVGCGPAFFLPSFISKNIQSLHSDMMVTFKVDAEARAIVQGSEEPEKYPIVAKVKGTGKDGALGVQVFGEGSSPLFAKISGDSKSPIAIAPIEVAPITVVPDLKLAAETLDIGAIVGALTRLSQGVKIEVCQLQRASVHSHWKDPRGSDHISVFSFTRDGIQSGDQGDCWCVIILIP